LYTSHYPWPIKLAHDHPPSWFSRGIHCLLVGLQAAVNRAQLAAFREVGELVDSKEFKEVDRMLFLHAPWFNQ